MNKIIIVLLALTICSCKGNEPTVKDQKAATSTPSCSPIKVIEGAYPSVKGNGMTINSQKIENNCLVLNVSYHGCKDITFNLLWNKMVKKSMPAQTSLYLEKIETTGHCHEDNQTELRFDLNALNSKTYGGKISLDVNGGEGILFEF
ncbi:MAG: hypothetical protein KDC83_00165 [Flavobacteriales bacterium]|nr:hypothetical protein [Flavobacteriales bacterium]